MSDRPQDQKATDAGRIESGERDRDSVRAVLRARARELAKPARGSEDVEDLIELVVLDFDAERYAIETELVKEVFAPGDLTLLPCAPQFLQGLINVRGKIVAVLDLRKILNLGDAGTVCEQAVIVDTGTVEVGFSVGECAVRHVPASTIQASTATGSGGRSTYVRAVTGDGIALLDVERIVLDTRQTAGSLASEAVR